MLSCQVEAVAARAREHKYEATRMQTLDYMIHGATRTASRGAVPRFHRRNATTLYKDAPRQPHHMTAPEATSAS
jgi:hypothetical protein